MDLLEILAKWLFWLFDGFGLNLILKKIAKAFDKESRDNTKSDSNLLASPKFPQV
ncbi:hypothetical protein GCM10028808_52200 [Spirosoma migulaei]